MWAQATEEPEDPAVFAFCLGSAGAARADSALRSEYREVISKAWQHWRREGFAQARPTVEGWRLLADVLLLLGEPVDGMPSWGPASPTRGQPCEGWESVLRDLPPAVAFRMGLSTLVAEDDPVQISRAEEFLEACMETREAFVGADPLFEDRLTGLGVTSFLRERIREERSCAGQ